MKKFSKKQFKEKHPYLFITLLHNIRDNEADMDVVKMALFCHPLSGSSGQVHVHAQSGFATINGNFLHYDVEFVVTSVTLMHVGLTLKKVIMYDDVYEYERAKEEPKLTFLGRVLKKFVDFVMLFSNKPVLRQPFKDVDTYRWDEGGQYVNPDHDNKN